ncbi:MAG: ribosome silencing factor, partial [bacterium]|nr:ribosome silencing factor [bacterium]
MAKTTSVPKRKVSSAASKALRRPKKVSLARRKAAVRKPAVKKIVPRKKLVIKKTAPVQKKTVRPQPKPDQVRALAHEISQLALSKKAFDVSVLEIKELSSVADYFVLASGATDIQVRAICHAIEDGLRAKGVKPHHVEGMAGATWVLLDYVDVVAHIMQPRA